MENIQFIIRRFNPEKDEKPYNQVYIVPFEEGKTVLDCLHYIKKEIDSTLSFRFSCRMGVCGSCAMLINGRARLACNTQVVELKSKKIAIAPLPNFETIRDLVPDLSPMFEKHKNIKPNIQREDYEEMENPTREYYQSEEELQKYLQFSYCIRCGACMSACPTMATDRKYFGPMVLAQAYRYNNDTRDNGSAIRHNIADVPSGIFSCHMGSECSIVCPKGVDPAKAIQLMKREMVFSFLKLLKEKKPCGLYEEKKERKRREGIPEPPAQTV